MPHRLDPATLALIFDSTTDLLFLMNVERREDGTISRFRCEAVNAVYREVTGLPDSALRGKTIEEILPPESAAFAIARYHEAIQAGTAVRYDERVALSTALVVVETTLHPIRDSEGVVTHLLGTARDVSALREAERAIRESEARHRALLDASPDGVFVHVDGQIRYVNHAAARLVGAAAPDALIGRPLTVVIPESDHEALHQRLSGVTQTGEGYLVEQLLCRLDNGELVPTEVSVTRTEFLENGRTVSAVQATVRDVSARLRADEERAELQRRLQQAQKLEAVGQLAGGLAHDLNNILLVISANRELASEDLPSDHPMSEPLAQMGEGIDRARRLIRSLLTFSRRDELRRERLDLTEAVREFAPLLRTAAGNRVRFTVDLPDAPVPMHVDRSHFEQICMNLIVNARDAVLTSSHGHDGHGGNVSLKLVPNASIPTDASRCAPEPESTTGEAPCGVALVVRDDGHGMDEPTRLRVFEPFFTTKGVGDGSGLGLSTVFGIVQQMHGRICIDSVPGRGTTVTVWMPGGLTSTVASNPANGRRAELLDVSVWRAPKNERRKSARLPNVAGAPRHTALLAEDDENVRVLTARVLRHLGIDVLEAADGEEALALWRTQRTAIDLLVTDIRMPSMGGVELAHRLRAEREDLPVVFMSGYTGATAQQWGAHCAFVEKPFAVKELMQAVLAGLGGPAAPNGDALDLK